MNVGVYMIYQKLALIDEFDIPNNIFLGKEIKKKYLGGLISRLDKKKMEEEAREILAPMRIRLDKQIFRTQVKNLSGGQRSAVAIGKVISNDAKVLVMDEPTASLGVKETRKFFDVINKLKEKGMSFIFISHRMQDVVTLCDRVVILRGGQKVYCEKIENTSIKEIIFSMVGGDLVETPYE
jgi:ABC-type sugar transport system ATPase subunit